MKLLVVGKCAFYVSATYSSSSIQTVKTDICVPYYGKNQSVLLFPCAQFLPLGNLAGVQIGAVAFTRLFARYVN